MTTQSIEEEVDAFEALTEVRTARMGGVCPFRGLPFRPALDERCPTWVSCVALPVQANPYGQIAPPTAHLTAILHEDTYCWTCVKDQVRERESGYVVHKFREVVKRRRVR